MRQGRGKAVRKGIDSTFLLVSWRLWKKRNECVFKGITPLVDNMMRELLEDASSWTQAGAKLLEVTGWLARHQHQLQVV